MRRCAAPRLVRARAPSGTIAPVHIRAKERNATPSISVRANKPITLYLSKLAHRSYGTDGGSSRQQRPFRNNSSPPPAPLRDESIGPDPEQLEKNLAEWLTTLALVAGVGVALLADAPAQEKEQNSRITPQTLGIFLLIGSSAFAMWAGFDYFRAASALADQLPVRGRTLRVVAFSLFLASAFAGAAALPPRVTPAKPEPLVRPS